MVADTTITRAAIHPAIGVARVGNSQQHDGFIIGLEVPDAPALPQGSYKDRRRFEATGRLFSYLRV
jgi:hypothetical protein